MGPHGGLLLGSARAAQAACRAAATPPLPSPVREASTEGSLAVYPMAAQSGPSSPIRCVVVHFYPGGLKGSAHPCELQFFGKRGKPVKKMRFIPAEKAHAIARKLQGTKGCTVSVI
ncbi:hypothetical protein [Cyanobium sp. ULC082]